MEEVEDMSGSRGDGDVECAVCRARVLGHWRGELRILVTAPAPPPMDTEGGRLVKVLVSD